MNGQRFLDVNRWHRQGRLQLGQWFSWRWSRDGETVASITVWTEPECVVLSYRIRFGGDDWQDVQERVWLTWSRCHYGGRRPWFVCPGVVNARLCGRRVGKLYGAGRYFRCRHCYGLAYESQREDRWDRALGRAWKIRRRLGGVPGLQHPFPGKPRGMHWRTYIRLLEDAEARERVSLEKVAMLLDRTTRQAAMRHREDRASLRARDRRERGRQRA